MCCFETCMYGFCAFTLSARSGPASSTVTTASASRGASSAASASGGSDSFAASAADASARSLAAASAAARSSTPARCRSRPSPRPASIAGSIGVGIASPPWSIARASHRSNASSGGGIFSPAHVSENWCRSRFTSLNRRISSAASAADASFVGARCPARPWAW
eukprot:30980-Pelagococcus_subviridis.AAC.22